MYWLIVSVLSGLTQLAGYAIYSKHVLFGKIRPNAASWSIWAFGAILESASYIFLTGDILKNVVPIICALCSILFFIFCLFRGHLRGITRLETYIVMIDIFITLIWIATKSPLYANILFVVTAVISFIPIIMHVYKNPSYENALPWSVWTAAYALQTIVVFGRFEKVEDFIYPAVFFVLHIIISILALDSRKKFHNKSYPDLTNKLHPEHL